MKKNPIPQEGFFLERIARHNEYIPGQRVT